MCHPLQGHTPKRPLAASFTQLGAMVRAAVYYLIQLTNPPNLQHAHQPATILPTPNYIQLTSIGASSAKSLVSPPPLCMLG